MADQLVFYHNPMSRGRIVHWMLEEVGAPYETKVVDLEKREHKSPAYLAVNPMGKIPAIVHGDTVVTETAAICAYLADAFPRAGLAPPPGDRARGTYYRWLFFAAGCLEPALVDRMRWRGRPSNARACSATATTRALSARSKRRSRPALGFSASASARRTSTSARRWVGGCTLKSLEPRPAFQKYIDRCAQRPAFKRANG